MGRAGVETACPIHAKFGPPPYARSSIPPEHSVIVNIRECRLWKRVMANGRAAHMAARLCPGDVGMRVPSLLDDPVPARHCRTPSPAELRRFEDAGVCWKPRAANAGCHRLGGGHHRACSSSRHIGQAPPGEASMIPLKHDPHHPLHPHFPPNFSGRASIRWRRIPWWTKCPNDAPTGSSH